MFFQNLTLLHLSLNSHTGFSPLLSGRYDELQVSKCYFNKQFNGLFNGEQSLMKILIFKTAFQRYLSSAITVSKSIIFERKLFEEPNTFTDSEIEVRYCLFNSFTSSILINTGPLKIYNTHFYNVSCSILLLCSSLNISQCSLNRVNCAHFSYIKDYQCNQSCDNTRIMKCECTQTFLDIKYSKLCNFTKNQIISCYSRDLADGLLDTRYLIFEGNEISDGIFYIHDSSYKNDVVEIQNCIFFNNTGFSYYSSTNLSALFNQCCFVLTNISINTCISFLECSFDFPQNNNYKYTNCVFSVDKCNKLTESIFIEENQFAYSIIKNNNELLIRQINE